MSILGSDLMIRWYFSASCLTGVYSLKEPATVLWGLSADSLVLPHALEEPEVLNVSPGAMFAGSGFGKPVAEVLEMGAAFLKRPLLERSILGCKSCAGDGGCSVVCHCQDARGKQSSKRQQQ